MAKTAARARKKEKKNVVTGVAHVNATFNNTIITITDGQGNAISWSSAGAIGFKGTKKGTPFAAQIAADSDAQSLRLTIKSVILIADRMEKELTGKDDY